MWMYPEDRYYYGWYGSVPPGQLPPADGTIKSEVVERLRANPHTRHHDLVVHVKDGVVILQGEVDSRVAKRAAGDDCWDTPGVVDVSNQLEVDESGGSASPVLAQVGESMSQHPVTIAVGASLCDAAASMASHDIGSVIVTDADGTVVGIVTDRDLVVRGLGRHLDPATSTVGDVYSDKLISCQPDELVDDAVATMRSSAIRRIPVLDNGRPVGMLTLGDLARTRDPGSVLADISAARPNN